MAHYAFLDENNIVTEVIVGKNEGEEGTDWEVHYGNFRGQTCKRTSYNTSGGVHSSGGTPCRKNYAGIGYTYDLVRDAFIPPKPYLSWLLDEGTCQWVPPVPMPDDGALYRWDEETICWVLMFSNGYSNWNPIPEPAATDRVEFFSNGVTTAGF